MNWRTWFSLAIRTRVSPAPLKLQCTIHGRKTTRSGGKLAAGKAAGGSTDCAVRSYTAATGM